jgi:formate dehydrogenase major subunit
VPTGEETTLAAYAARYGTDAAAGLAALLAAWFAAPPGEAYGWLPRQGANRPSTYLPILAAMAAGQFKAALAVGSNFLVSTPDNRLAAQALAALDTLAVVDLFPSETAEFWRLPAVRPADVKTEVLTCRRPTCMRRKARSRAAAGLYNGSRGLSAPWGRPGRTWR